MPRIGRIIIEGITHHVTHNSKKCKTQNIFFHDEDCLEYLKLLGEMGKIDDIKHK